jgi:hypothetical protein
MTTYNVSVRIVDGNGKRIEKHQDEFVSDIRYQMYVHNIDVLSARMKEKHNEIMLTLPKDHKVFLSARKYNEISGTWMEMASYYGGENRFVIHS